MHYPPAPDYAPHLGEHARELYEKSGLTAADYPICDFQPKEGGGRGAARRKMLALQAQTQNAAAVNISKPVIMISQPLLKLLDDDEEKAVLAHEFAHAKARHSHVTLGQGVLGGIGAVNNTLSILVAELSLGFVPVIAALGAGIVGRLATTTALGKVGLMVKREKTLSTRELLEKTKAGKTIKAVSTVATVAALTYFSPAFLGVWAAF